MRCLRATQGAGLAATEGTNEGHDGADVGLTIARFDPRRVPPEVWAAIAPLARDAVAKVEPSTPRDATELLSRTALLLSWCHGQGLELMPAVVFAPETLDRFVAHGCAELAKGTRINYRRILRRVGAAVLGPPIYPERPLALEKSDPSAPYSFQDERALTGWSRGLPTDRMRDAAIALLGLGLGAGLTAREINLAEADWVEQAPAGLVIAVPGGRSRRVPVVARWEWAVRDALAQASGGPLFLPGRTSRRKKQVSVFTENLPAHHKPKLSAQRMRVTWIVRHLDGRVPLHVLAEAAGVGADQLSSYATFMAPCSLGQADRLLRGEPT
jgi:hypothetical protein